MFFNWTVTTMCYYGLTSAAATLTPDLYLNFTLAILVEVSDTVYTISVLTACRGGDSKIDKLIKAPDLANLRAVLGV